MKEEDSSPEISEKEMLRGLRRRLPLERLRITVKTCGVVKRNWIEAQKMV
jgi:hypothetical protein